MNGALEMFTVYRNPADYPGKIVVRRSVATPDGTFPDPDPWIVCYEITAARKALPPGLYRLERHPADDPVIVEVWI